MVSAWLLLVSAWFLLVSEWSLSISARFLVVTHVILTPDPLNPGNPGIPLMSSKAAKNTCLYCKN